MPLNLRSESPNPVIIIQNRKVYNRIYELANDDKNLLIDIKQKTNTAGPATWELQEERTGFLVHLYDLDNPQEYRETIFVGKDFTKLENRERIKEYIPTSRVLEAYLFTLGADQGIFIRK